MYNNAFWTMQIWVLFAEFLCVNNIFFIKNYHFFDLHIHVVQMIKSKRTFQFCLLVWN